MTGTLAFVFIGVALLCIVAGVAAVTRTRRRVRDDERETGDVGDEATYAEEAAAVAAAQAAAAAAAAEQDDEADGTRCP